MKSFAKTAQTIARHFDSLTPEEWHEYYRGTYPDITRQESGMLYPLFLQATDTGRTAQERNIALYEYRRQLAPIIKRNPQKRDRGLFYD